MLLFIVLTQTVTFQVTEFQYISCYSLSRISYRVSSANAFQCISCYSLSMPCLWKIQCNRAFQYISCYSLSATTQLVFQYMSSFNTSHVTLYLTTKKTIKGDDEFQYISCYSLSKSYVIFLKNTIVSIHLMLLFIIISYPPNLLYLCSFNTSHVTLYRNLQRRRIYKKRVSIHLMLLFILN